MPTIGNRVNPHNALHIAGDRVRTEGPGINAIKFKVPT